MILLSFFNQTVTADVSNYVHCVIHKQSMAQMKQWLQSWWAYIAERSEIVSSKFANVAQL